MTFDPDQLNRIIKATEKLASAQRNQAYAHIYAAVYIQTASKVTAREAVEHFRNNVESK